MKSIRFILLMILIEVSICFYTHPVATAAEQNETKVKQATEGVTVRQFIWDKENHFSFSLYNQLKEPVVRVGWVAIFNDANGVPVDFIQNSFSGIIPPGLAKRVHGTCALSTYQTGKDVKIKIIEFLMESTFNAKQKAIEQDSNLQRGKLIMMESRIQTLEAHVQELMKFKALVEIKKRLEPRIEPSKNPQ